MSLVLHGGNTTFLNPIDVIRKIWLVEVEDLVEVLDSTLVTLISIRFDVAKDSRVLIICPVRELVVTKNEVWTVGGVVIVDNPVPVKESL